MDPERKSHFMKIGIVSDSHGKAKRLRAAIDALAERGIDALVHCGDIDSPQCLEMLGETGVPAYAVAGNMDRKLDVLGETARKSGVKFSSEVVEVPLGNGEYLIATHGNDDRVLGELIADEQFPYVCHGHTHRFRDERRGRVRIINPGALAHPKGPRHPTAVLLDTETDTLERIDL